MSSFPVAAPLVALVLVECVVGLPKRSRWPVASVFTAIAIAAAAPDQVLPVAVVTAMVAAAAWRPWEHRRPIAAPALSRLAVIVATAGAVQVLEPPGAAALGAAVAVLAGHVGNRVTVSRAAQLIGSPALAALVADSAANQLLVVPIAIAAAMISEVHGGRFRSRNLEPNTGLEVQASSTRPGVNAEAAGAIFLARMPDITATIPSGDTDALMAQIGRRVRPYGAMFHSEDMLTWSVPRSEALEMQQAVLQALKELKRPIKVGNYELLLNPAAGLAIEPGASAHHLRRAVRAARHAATVPGRVWIDRATDWANHDDDLRLIADIPTAITAKQVTPAYQPLVNRHGEVIAVEALARWDHPQHGNVPPSRFIPLAARSGTLSALTISIINQTLAHLEQWHADGHMVWAQVNLDPSLLNDPDWFSEIQHALARSNVDPKWLLLEITESEAIQPETERVIFELRELGMRIAIDDFGVGQSSLARLRDMPIDQLKFDRSFTEHVDTDPHAAAVLAATLRLADVLGIQTVCEGVETDGQAEKLNRLGCDIQQGYLYGRPVVSEQLFAGCAAVPHDSSSMASENAEPTVA